MQRTLSSIVNDEALEYAMYTIENRALANGIDGLKPVQRFVLYNVIKDASTSFDKVAALGSSVSKIGYNHGETSAQDALALMAAEWQNNVPIVQGRGNFGSRMVKESASARYVYAKLHDNFDLYFKDIHLSPEHKDLEHVPPQFYVPVLPMILMNGVQGIATGFACNILPHDPEWVKKAVLEYLAGKEISEPVVKFPEFYGKIEKLEHNKYAQIGTVEISGLTAVVTEIPTGFDHAKYIIELDKLVEKGKISSYVDETSETFQFRVRFKRGAKMTEESVIKTLKLQSTFTQNINVIDENYQIRHFDDVRELVKWFVDFRMSFLPKRIQDSTERTEKRASLAIAKVEFIKRVVSGTIILFGKKRAEVAAELKADEAFSEHVTELLNMSVDKMTDDEIARLEKDATVAQKELSYWQKTTAQKEFIKDIKAI
ncbi:topoisomerase II small subunit [Vibrio phage KVP40]|uniref:DNA topoisomerase (ATP-hydrolyzing) n=2 Tax=Schizotequatrovirus KVP40 TaxID=1914019 RepID=Q6WHM1_BPKVM|nr:DNA topoisomerase II [Vibrio phage KVP40]AAQ64352.1 topoisomerase II small subunit [Vibrio phage KVP40]QIW91132.1 DNA topoisomerase medium subunit [Vibrio phage V09]